MSRTEEIVLIGPHGVGKTTLISALAKRLDKSGFSVYVHPEMNYIPDISIQTIDFQLWFKKQIIIRNIGMDAIRKAGIVDYIIKDRDTMDIDIYTSRITDPGRPAAIPFFDVPPDNIYIFHIDLDIELLTDRILKRVTSDQWRSNWNELDVHYLDDISERFRDYAKFHDIETIVNVDLENTVETIINRIY